MSDALLGAPSTAPLFLSATMGISGNVPHALHIHPTAPCLFFPVGASIALCDTSTFKTAGFLSGCPGSISCLTMSPRGTFIACSGRSPDDLLAEICVFVFSEKRLAYRLALHKTCVEALAFSPGEEWLASIGSVDDGAIAVWDMRTGRPLCGTEAGAAPLSAVTFLAHSPQLITGGDQVLTLWSIDAAARKMTDTRAALGNLRRKFTCIVVERRDRYAYCGTTSGDIVCMQLKGPFNCKMVGPRRGNRIAGGVMSLVITATEDLLAGFSAGQAAILSKTDLSILKSVTLEGSVTAVAALEGSYYAYTDHSNLYYISARSYKEELRQTCHFTRINGLAFPEGYSAVFATCGGNDVRLWNATTCAELLRLRVGTSGLVCNCVCFAWDGTTVLTGWSDGKVRAFGPESGTLIFAIKDAHSARSAATYRDIGAAGCTAVCGNHGGGQLISGGADGLVRIWSVQGQYCRLFTTLSEHKGAVTGLVIGLTDQECFSASLDGCVIVWDLATQRRRFVLYGTGPFNDLCLSPDESQLLTASGDHRITFWDAAEGSSLRKLDACFRDYGGGVNSLDIAQPDAKLFVTGGADRLVRVWDYDTGKVLKVGKAHSAPVIKVRIAPDGRHVVAIGADGAFTVWTVEKDMDVS